MLNLSRTGIMSLPGEVSKLTNLEIPDLSGTKITSLPGEIKDLSDTMRVIYLKNVNLVEKGKLGKSDLIKIFKKYGQLIF